MSANRRLQRSGIAKSKFDRIMDVGTRARPYKGNWHECPDCRAIGPLVDTDTTIRLPISPNIPVLTEAVKGCRCIARINREYRHENAESPA